MAEVLTSFSRYVVNSLKVRMINGYVANKR